MRCECYPANEYCPSAVVCNQRGNVRTSPRWHEEPKRGVGADVWFYSSRVTVAILFCTFPIWAALLAAWLWL